MRGKPYSPSQELAVLLAIPFASSAVLLPTETVRYGIFVFYEDGLGCLEGPILEEILSVLGDSTPRVIQAV